MFMLQSTDFWQTTWFGATTRQLATAAAVTAAVLALLLLIRWLLCRQLERVAGRTANHADDFALQIVRKTHFYFIAFVAVYAGVRALPLAAAAAYALRVAGVFAFTLQLAAWGNAIIAAYLGRQIKRRMSRDAASATTMTAVGYIIRFVFYVVLLVLALDNLGFEVRTLVTTLGIGGIAIALALQKVLGDLFGSLSIVLDKPFVLGDAIAVGDLSGTVEHIGLKTTRLRSLSGEQLVFSNSDLLEARIRNFQRLRERRVVITIGVTYQTPRTVLAAIPGVLQEAVLQHEQARFDRAHLSTYGPSSIDFELVYTATTNDYATHMSMKQAIYLEIHRRFEEMGVSFAYPTTTVILERAGAAGSALQDAAGVEVDTPAGR